MRRTNKNWYKTPFKPTRYSHGPHARAAHDAGGALMTPPMISRALFNAQIKAYAPGCGGQVRLAGTSGGFARCGSTVRWPDGKTEKVYCGYCGPTIESFAEAIVNSLLEAV
jgi:hypothetical protein